jgi:carbamoyl-phosphate synthase small subunit
VIPGNYSAEDILALKPKGIVLSNGPGDPSINSKLIDNIKKLILSRIPVLGICFGHQLIGIAAGGEAIKMKFGHHGINHPIHDLKNDKVYITSQNHNFMIERKHLPDSLEITHVSLFDGSIQGFRLKGYPVFGFQGHPEGSPGPQDISCLFEIFINHIKFNTSNLNHSCH